MKVSIVTPVYNGEKTIARCIESVLSQSHPDIEYLIIDGGSTDNTVNIIKDYGVRYISECDAGVYDAFNKGIRISSGEIVHILNSDDVYRGSDRVALVIEVMEEKKLDVCHGYVELCNENNQNRKLIGKNVTKHELLKKMRVAHPSTFVRRQVYETYGTFSVGFKVAADHDFLLRIWDDVEVGFIPEIIVDMSVGGISTSQYKTSYAESFAASLINGYSPWEGFINYNYEMIKNYILDVIKRKY
jgi:glycosyltransferase